MAVVEGMNIKKRTTYTSSVRAFLQRIARITVSTVSRFIKTTASGKRYLAIPLPGRTSLIRFSIIALVIIAIGFLSYRLYRFFGPHNYAVASVDSLLSAPYPAPKDSLTFDTEKNHTRSLLVHL